MKKDWQKIENYLTQFPYYTKQNLSLIFNKKDYAYDYWVKKLIKEKILILLKKEEIVDRVIDKLIKIDEKEIFLDLSPFIADQNYLKNFLENYRDFIKNKIKFII